MGLYYNDLVTAAEKDVSSRNLLTLVDVAVSLFEEEDGLGLTETGQYKCDNDRIFLLFPRKKRSSVYRRRIRNPQQPKLLHGGASASPLLLDLNTVPVDDSEPQNPLQWLDSKNPQKPRCFKRLRVKIDSKVKKSRNPNSQARTSRKRCAEQDLKPRGGSKKAKRSHIVNPLLSWRGRDTPESILRVMRHMNVTEQEPKLIFERILYQTDVAPNQSRLSMPITQVYRNDFLTPEETQILLQDINNNHKTGVDAFLLNQHSHSWDVKLKRWEYKGGGWTYTVTCAWNEFVQANGLVEDNGISVWTFRSGGLLCFAVLPLHTMGQCSGYAVPRWAIT